MAGATHRALAGLPMSASPGAPWHTDPKAMASKIRVLERRVNQLEGIVSRQAQKSAGGASVIRCPELPLFPPAGTLPKAMEKLKETRHLVQEHEKQLQLIYDYIVSKWPSAVADMESIQARGTLSPEESDVELEPADNPNDDAAEDDDTADDLDTHPKRRKLNRAA